MVSISDLLRQGNVFTAAAQEVSGQAPAGTTQTAFDTFKETTGQSNISPLTTGSGSQTTTQGSTGIHRGGGGRRRSGGGSSSSGSSSSGSSQPQPQIKTIDPVIEIEQSKPISSTQQKIKP